MNFRDWVYGEVFSRYCKHYRVLYYLSLICGCKHDWPSHVKTLVYIYVDFFIFMFFN